MRRKNLWKIVDSNGKIYGKFRYKVTGQRFIGNLKKIYKKDMELVKI